MSLARGVVLAALVPLAPAIAADRGSVGLGWFAATPAGLPLTGGALLPFIALPDTADEPAEDRIATLGAAFLAEVLGPRPRVPQALAGAASGLRDLIARVESGAAGYDAVVYGATIQPPRPPSRLTLSEIERWIAATPGQNHAIGRYQIVPKTLTSLRARLSLSGSARFSPALQDRLADVLIADAGHAEFLAGAISRRDFMRNLAAIWAGLPGPDGRSLYAGIAGNTAGMTWLEFHRHMARIYPE